MDTPEFPVGMVAKKAGQILGSDGTKHENGWAESAKGKDVSRRNRAGRRQKTSDVKAEGGAGHGQAIRQCRPGN